MALSKLDAINVCLRGIGALEVTLASTSTDKITAESIIDGVSTQLQSRGWWFNKEENFLLTLDVNGEILVPAVVGGEIIELVSWGASRECQFTIRYSSGVPKIYDTYNHTYDHTDSVLSDGTIEFLMIIDLEFESMPVVARNAVMYKARRMFAQDIEGDNVTYQQHMRDEQQAMEELERANFRNRKHNAINHSGRNMNALSRIGGQNSRAMLGSFPRRSSV